MMKNIFWLLFLFTFFIESSFADSQEEIDKIMKLPNEFLKKIDERDILTIYFAYEDLNEYLLSIDKDQIFCAPKDFDPLNLIKLVGEDLSHPKYYLGKEKIDARHSVAGHIAAILINKFPCESKNKKINKDKKNKN